MEVFRLDEPYVILTAIILAFVVSLTASFAAMRSRALIDAPNQRSSHTAETSRAGGVAMLIGIVVGLFVLGAFSTDGATREAAWRFIPLAVLAGAVGLADDRLTLGAMSKFTGQFIVAIGFVWLFGSLQAAPLPLLGDVSLGVLGPVLTVFWIVAFMNVFNFMDGVNGIAGGVGVVGLSAMCAAGAFLGGWSTAGVALVGVVAILGFLPANILHGRLFMGDCGSHLIAFLIAGLAVHGASQSNNQIAPLFAPVIFLPFILDVAFTLAHRILRRQNLAQAHREHLYQLILRQGLSHGEVAAIYAGMTAFSAAGAFFILVLSPATHWWVVVFIAALFLLFAGITFKKARDAGLLSPSSGAAGSRQPGD